MLGRAPVRNEHDDMDGDDNRVTDPYPGDRQRTGGEIEEDAAMQEAQQASLLSLIAESRSYEGEAAMQEAQQASLLLLIAESRSYRTDGDNEEAEGPFAEWYCEACTYMNSRGGTCAMCGTDRD
jgi:hypothetical protein